jgi:hypothetical protein
MIEVNRELFVGFCQSSCLLDFVRRDVCRILSMYQAFSDDFYEERDD